jgi:lysozyme family protein
MTQQQAAGIFADEYWVAAWSGLPQYLTVPMLSFAVVDGPTQAAFALQRALVVKADGVVGAQTIAAAGIPPPKALLESYFGECLTRFQQSPRWATDGTGWGRRQLAASLEAITW